MKLSTMITRLEDGVFDHLTKFWGIADASEAMRRKALVSRMTDRETVQRRLTVLPEALRELLGAIIQGIDFSRPFRLTELDLNGLTVQPHELDASGLALTRRGFLASQHVRTQTGRHRSYTVPEELGDVLVRLFQTRKSAPPEASLRLRAGLRWLGGPELTERLEAIERPDLIGQEPRAILRELCRRTSIADRVDRLEDPELRAAIDEVFDAGGILDGDGRRARDVDVSPERLRRWGRDLTKNFLGAFAELDLTDHGISVRDGWLVLFAELVEARLAAERPDEDEADEDLERTPDILADLGTIALEIEETPFRVRKNGEFYRSAVKKLAKNVLSPGFRPAGAEADVEFCLQFMLSAELVAPRTDGRLVLQSGWREWETGGAVDRTEEILDESVESAVGFFSPQHEITLRQELLHELKEFGVGRWIRVREAVTVARNRHLRRALQPEHARRYQERHKNSPLPRLASSELMRQALRRFLFDHVARLGIVEVAVNEDDGIPWAVRLTPLGGAVLGLDITLEVEPGEGLIVNPDCEVIVVPESAGVDVVQRVGRFATRLKADYAIHFMISKESIQAAAAAGLDDEDILSTLRDNSRHPIPQNVEYSIREWCRKVVRLAARRSYLVEGPDKATVDRILQVPEFDAIVARRLTSKIVELTEDPTRAGIVTALREQGIYL